MDFAKLDILIQIKQASSLLDSLGEHAPVWSTLHECFAQRRSRMGREFMRADRNYAEANEYFTIRPRSGITTDMRVETTDGVQHHIIDVLKSDRRGESMLLVTRTIR